MSDTENKPIVTECPRIKALLERVEELEGAGISDERILKKEGFSLNNIRRLKQETKDDLWAKMWDGQSSCGREIASSGVCGSCYNLLHSKSITAANRRYERSNRVRAGQTDGARKAKLEHARRTSINEKLQAWLDDNPDATEADKVLYKNKLEVIQRKDARGRQERYSEKITHDGQTLSIQEWASKLKLLPSTIMQRLSIPGLGMDDVLNPYSLPPWKALGVRPSSSISSGKGLIQKLRFVLDAQIEENPEDVLERIDKFVHRKIGREILRMRFIDTDKYGNRGCIHAVPAEKFGLTRERIRQLENEALNQLFSEEIEKGYFELIKPK